MKCFKIAFLRVQSCHFPPLVNFTLKSFNSLNHGVRWLVGRDDLGGVEGVKTTYNQNISCEKKNAKNKIISLQSCVEKDCVTLEQF